MYIRIGNMEVKKKNLSQLKVVNTEAQIKCITYS